MPKFEVTAAKKDSGETHQYIIEATDAEAAAKKARSRGLFPTEVKKHLALQPAGNAAGREKSDTQILLDIAKHSKKTASRVGWILAIQVLFFIIFVMAAFSGLTALSDLGGR